jgi:hypothetical protein
MDSKKNLTKQRVMGKRGIPASSWLEAIDSAHWSRLQYMACQLWYYISIKEFEFLDFPLKSTLAGLPRSKASLACLSAPSYHHPDFQYSAQWNEFSLTSHGSWWFLQWSQVFNVSCSWFPSLLISPSFLQYCTFNTADSKTTGAERENS